MYYQRNSLPHPGCPSPIGAGTTSLSPQVQPYPAYKAYLVEHHNHHSSNML